MNLKSATLVTSLLASVLAIGKFAASYAPRLSSYAHRLSAKPRRLHLVRDPIGIQEPLAGALERADSLQARPKTEGEALARASAWAGLPNLEPSTPRT